MLRYLDNGLNVSKISNKINGFNCKETNRIPDCAYFGYVGSIRYPACVLLRRVTHARLRAFFIPTVGGVFSLRGYPDGCRIPNAEWKWTWR